MASGAEYQLSARILLRRLFGDMRNLNNRDWTAAELAVRWNYKSPSSVLRVMLRFGISGRKFGAAKQAARRFSDSEVQHVERLLKR